MPDRSERVETLFHAALQLEGRERERFLASCCDDDTKIRRDVEALLEADARSEDALAASAPEMLALGDSPSALLVGRRLGPYELRRCLATGGMGAVYEAAQESPHRTVAVKVLRADVASPDLRQRFRVEASWLARLQHPGIAHIYGADVADLDGIRVPYIAMELVAGARPLTTYAREEQLGIARRIELFTEVCDAVHHGHQRGVIHRDLKPGNVLVDREGRPKLIDFGVARAVDPEAATRRTEAGALLGTVQYMSPEQCVDASDLDVRSDVYSLGVLLYELLCERLPYDFAGVPLPQAARIVQEGSPRRPSTAGAAGGALRGDVETILLKALEKDRARRYQSARDLADDLRRYLRREPITARAPSWPYRFALFARRHKALVGALTAVFLVAVGAAVVSARFALREKSARQREERSSYLANIAAADASLRVHDAAGARRRLTRVPPELRGWEWRHLNGRLDLALLTLAGPLSRCDAVAWDGDRIAGSWWTTEREYLLTVWDAVTGAELARSAPQPILSSTLDFAHDGRVVLGRDDGRILFWDPTTGSLEAFPVSHDGPINGVRVAADGRIVVAGEDGLIKVWDAQPGALPMFVGPVLGDGCATWFDLDLSPDEERVVAASGDGTVRVYELDSGAETVLRGHERAVLGVAFHPGGTVVASGSRDGTVRLWDLASQRETRRLVGHEGEVMDVAFLPDGLLVSASTDGTVRVWDVAAGEVVHVLYGHENWVASVVPSPDGTKVATGAFDGTVRVWDPRAEPGTRELAEHTALVYGLAYSSDATRLATASRDGTARIYDTATWEELVVLPDHDAQVMSVSFHPAGELLATGDREGRTRIWNAASGRLLRTLAGHEDNVRTLAFSPRGDLLATASRDALVLLRETEGFEVVATLAHDRPLESLAFDGTGERIATVAVDGRLYAWDVDEARELWRRDTGTRLFGVAFSPDGRLIAAGAGDFDGTGLGVRLWDAATGEPRATLVGHTDVVYAVDFSPDGERLVSASADGTVRLWDPATADEVLVLRGHESWVWSVAFAPDGATIASGGGNYDGTGVGVRLWEAPDPHE